MAPAVQEHWRRQFSSMVTLQPGGASNPLSLQLNPGSNPSSALSSQSFMQALSDAIAGTLERFGIDPSSVTLDLGSKGGQKSGTGQASATTPPVTAAVSLLSASPATTSVT